METAVNRKLYEGMFLVDSAKAANWDATKAALENALKRADAEIVDMKKWDDRRLAYEIQGKARGTYILCYFKADGEKIQDIEKAVQLSEQIMRVLILSTEQMTAEDMGKDTPAARAENEAAAAEEARAARVAEAAKTAQAAESASGRKPEQKDPEVKAGEAVPMDIGIESGEAAPEAGTTGPEAGTADPAAGIGEEDAEVKEADKSDKPEEPESRRAGKEPQESDAGNMGEGPAEADSEQPKESRWTSG